MGEAVSTWVLADAATHKLAHMGRITEFQGTDGGPLCKERTLSRVRLPETMEHADSRAMHYSDTDVNGHVNNVRYVDFLCDALHMERLGPSRFVSSLPPGGLPGRVRGGETIELIPDRGGPAACGTSTGRIRRARAGLTARWSWRSSPLTAAEPSSKIEKI